MRIKQRLLYVLCAALKKNKDIIYRNPEKRKSHNGIYESQITIRMFKIPEDTRYGGYVEITATPLDNEINLIRTDLSAGGFVRASALVNAPSQTIDYADPQLFEKIEQFYAQHGCPISFGNV